MKALVCHRFGAPEALEVAEMPVPGCSADELLVRVRGAGLNFADLLFLRGEYQTRVEPPFIPGAEIYGEVIETGAQVAGFSRSDLVIGQVLTGAYAEFAAMDPKQTVRLPAPMPAQEAAGFFINHGTAYSALVQRARATSGEFLLVLGAAGGVGLAAVQVGKALGMQVLADCRGPGKQDLARAQGAFAVVHHGDARFREQVLDLTRGRGVDVVLDMVGGAATAAALRCIAWCGRIVIIGFAGGEAMRIPSNHLLVKNCAVIGHWWGDYHRRDRNQLDAAFEQLFAWYAEGLVKPYIAGVLALPEVPAALQRFAQRTVLGKLVMLTQDHPQFPTRMENPE